MIIDKIHRVGKNILIVNLVPKNKQIGDCFCQFIPGQYVEVQIPDSDWMSRAYSIGNSPREDGSIELQIHRVEGGRFSSWAFEKMKSGDVISVRGPLGSFTFGSNINTPVLFVAGGTGFAPIKSIMEQLFKIFNDRTVTLVWGAHDSNGFYELDVIGEWLNANQNFQCFLATSNVSQGFAYPTKCILLNKSLSDALFDIDLLTPQNYDAYVAGPPSMMTSILSSMLKKGILREHIKVDSFGG
jgi:CDP-4-dehydro-6-deoxyglucose reductase